MPTAAGAHIATVEQDVRTVGQPLAPDRKIRRVLAQRIGIQHRGAEVQFARAAVGNDMHALHIAVLPQCICYLQNPVFTGV